MDRSAAIAALLREGRDIWSANQIAPVQARRSEYQWLDELLPGHGWPTSVLIELIPMAEGIGELRLVLPALKRLCREGRDIVFIRPPHLPYPPALAQAGLPLNRIIWIAADSDADARWAAEQTLREGTAGAVLLWSDVAKDVLLRRLQLAAREAETLTFLYRSPMSLQLASPAAVRVAMHPLRRGMRVEILKAQGGRTGTVTLSLADEADEAAA
jgi:protein ImuA